MGVKRLGLAVALLVLVSGCNAVGGTNAPAPAETATAAPVPTVEATATPTGTPGECASPRPAAAPESTPAPRAEAVALTDADGEVGGATLAASHRRALTNYSFHLRAGTSGEVWSLPDAAAFTYEGPGLGVGAPWAYAVGGRLYTLRTDEGQLVFDERDYSRDSRVRERLVSVLTGEHWLAGEIGPYNYTVVDTREYRGTTVRVLQDTRDRGVVVQPSARSDAFLFVNSTVYVGPHGIVRRVRHVEQNRYRPSAAVPNRTVVATFAVDQVGTADIHRPAAFCVTDPSAMRTAEPIPGQRATVAGSTGAAANGTATETPS
jgi:hypothetical protein